MNSGCNKFTGDSKKFKGAAPEFLATPKLSGISFVRYPLSKKVMASLNVWSVHAVPRVLNDTTPLGPARQAG